MNILKLSPVFFSFLLVAAHFHRAGESIPVTLCLIAPCLLLIARPWSMRLIQFLLLAAAGEWLYTLLTLVDLRQELGLPWGRLAIILGSVSFLTAASVLVFRAKSLKMRYQPGVESERIIR